MSQIKSYLLISKTKYIKKILLLKYLEYLMLNVPVILTSNSTLINGILVLFSDSIFHVKIALNQESKSLIKSNKTLIQIYLLLNNTLKFKDHSMMKPLTLLYSLMKKLSISIQKLFKLNSKKSKLLPLNSVSEDALMLFLQMMSKMKTFFMFQLFAMLEDKLFSLQLTYRLKEDLLLQIQYF